MKYVVTPMIVEIFNAPESIVKRNVSRARIFLRESERISFPRIELSLLQVSDELQLDAGTCASLFSKQGRAKVWDFQEIRRECFKFGRAVPRFAGFCQGKYLNCTRY